MIPQINQSMEIRYDPSEQPQPSQLPLPLSLPFIQDLMLTFRGHVTQLVANHNVIPAELIQLVFEKTKRHVLQQHRSSGIGTPSKSLINYCYVEYVNQGKLEPDGLFDTITTNIGVRSISGVLEVTVGLEGMANDGDESDAPSSCKYNCSFCPNERKKFGATHNIARSYLSNEGVFKAGLREDFDAYRLVIHRLVELETLGHVVDKIEMLVLGGTFHSYPKEYRDRYLADVWQATVDFHHFSSRFQGRYAGVIRQWVINGGLLRTLRDIPDWNGIVATLDQQRTPVPEGMKPIVHYQNLNENSICSRCVGLSLETRPDEISRAALIELRDYGCTRLQLGIQHLDPKVLAINNRRHSAEASAKAIQQCLDAGFKVDLHLMLDLPGSSPDMDLKYLRDVFTGDRFQSDYCKLYFCLNLPWTEIRRWYNRDKAAGGMQDQIHQWMTDPSVSYEELLELCGGRDNFIWRPYAESNPEQFRETSETALMMVPPWTRCVRVQRDFCRDRKSQPNTELVETTTDEKLLGYFSSTINNNERQLIQARLVSKGQRPVEIRTREVKNNIIPNLYNGDLHLVHCIYRNAGGTEHYVSLEYGSSVKQQPYSAINLGHVRVRIPDRYTPTMLPDIYQKRQGGRTALLRELHINGAVAGVTEIRAQQFSSGQSRGFGTMLLHVAEEIAVQSQCNCLAVISGVGVRGFYRKFGYQLTTANHYMVKWFPQADPSRRSFLSEMKPHPTTPDAPVVSLSYMIITRPPSGLPSELPSFWDQVRSVLVLLLILLLSLVPVAVLVLLAHYDIF